MDIPTAAGRGVDRMLSVGTIAAVDFALGTIAGLALLYLLVSDSVVHYDRFFAIITVGLLGYAVTGPVIGTFEPALIHFVHGLATLAIAVGCYGLVRTELRPSDDFETILGVRDDTTADVPETGRQFGED